jgi:hypothetical protein
LRADKEKASMLKCHALPDEDIIEIEIEGPINREQFDDVAALIEKTIETHGRVRVLEVVKNIGMFPASVFWDDLSFAMRHLNDFSRCAVVSDKTWLEWFTRALKPVLPCELEHFALEELEAARAWLRREGLGAAKGARKAS